MIYISRKSTLFKSFTYVSMYTLHTGTNSMQLLICQRFNRIFSICVKMFNEFWTHFCEFIEMNAKIYVQTHAFDGHPSNPSKKKQYKIHLNANNARIFAKLSLTRAPVAVVVVLFVFASLAISLTVVIRLSGSWKTIVILICLRIVYGTLNPLVHVKWFRS